MAVPVPTKSLFRYLNLYSTITFSAHSNLVYLPVLVRTPPDYQHNYCNIPGFDVLSVAKDYHVEKVLQKMRTIRCLDVKKNHR